MSSFCLGFFFGLFPHGRFVTECIVFSCCTTLYRYWNGGQSTNVIGESSANDNYQRRSTTMRRCCDARVQWKVNFYSTFRFRGVSTMSTISAYIMLACVCRVFFLVFFFFFTFHLPFTYSYHSKSYVYAEDRI